PSRTWRRSRPAPPPSRAASRPAPGRGTSIPGVEQWEGQRSAEEAAPNSVEAPVEEPEWTSEIVDQDPAGDGADDAPRRQYSGVGARVTAVLTAAEKAAEQMLTLAREEADELRRQAHSEAEA